MRDRVLIEIGVDRRLGGLLGEGWTGKIGESLAQVDGAVLVGQAAHLGEDRGAETPHPRRSSVSLGVTRRISLGMCPVLTKYGAQCVGNLTECCSGAQRFSHWR